jgi:hypothetical protein
MQAGTRERVEQWLSVAAADLPHDRLGPPGAFKRS